MLLAIDIGNTNIGMGVFKRTSLLTDWRISTRPQRTVDEYCITLTGLFENAKIKLNAIDGILISSVVPRVSIILKTALSRLFDVTPLILGENIEAPIKNLYDDPRQVGQDRLVNAVSAYRNYGGPVIVVDFGTAITFDVVSAQGEYLGGLIAPGIDISLEALAQKAALLPKVELDKPKGLLGKNTVDSIRGGILYGFGALCDGIVARLKKEFGKNFKVIVTGGHAELITSYCKTIDKVNGHLTLEGLRIIYYEHYRSKKAYQKINRQKS